MGCNSDYMEPNAGEINSKETAQHLVYVFKKLGKEKELPEYVVKAAQDYYGNPPKLNDMVVMLCDTLSHMKKTILEKVVYDAHSKEARELADWWEEHKEADKQRIAREKQEQDGKALAKKAAAKKAAPKKKVAAKKAAPKKAAPKKAAKKTATAKKAAAPKKAAKAPKAAAKPSKMEKVTKVVTPAAAAVAGVATLNDIYNNKNKQTTMDMDDDIMIEDDEFATDDLSTASSSEEDEDVFDDPDLTTYNEDDEDDDEDEDYNDPDDEGNYF